MSRWKNTGTAKTRLRIITASGAAPIATTRVPAQVRIKTAAPHKAAVKKTKTGSGSRSSTSHSSSSQTIVQDVLAALQGGDLRLAVEDIARQVFLEMLSEQQSATQQSGSYQRQGGF
jgi:hypothetical protein